jgi:hypothetical protein
MHLIRHFEKYCLKVETQMQLVNVHSRNIIFLNHIKYPETSLVYGLSSLPAFAAAAAILSYDCFKKGSVAF